MRGKELDGFILQREQCFNAQCLSCHGGSITFSFGFLLKKKIGGPNFHVQRGKQEAGNLDFQLDNEEEKAHLKGICVKPITALDDHFQGMKAG